MKAIVLGMSFFLLSLAVAGQARAYEVTLGSSGEPSLQSILNSHIGGGTIDAFADQLATGIWHASGTPITVYSMAGYRGDSGVLGVFSLADGHQYNLAFNGLSSTLFISAAGELIVNNVVVDSNFGNYFGFYWMDTQAGYGLTSYTDDALNAPGQGYGPHNSLAVRYLVDEGLSLIAGQNLQGPTLQASGDNDWILAFEDRSFPGGDHDFNDAVFYVENIVPAPEPGSLALLLGGGGLLAFVGLRRRCAKHG
jgi:hypothetical protein